MGKFLLGVLQIIIFVKLVYSFIRLMIHSKKISEKSIVGKAWKLLVTNKVHHYLDNALRKQKAVLHSSNEEVAPQPSNVIPLRKTK